MYRWIRLSFCFGVLLAMIGAVQRADVSAETAPSAPTTAPVQLDALIEGHHGHGGTTTHGGTTHATNGTPTINILSPSDSAVLGTRDVEISFETLDHVVGPIGTNHIHFHLDGDPLPYMMFNGDDPAQFGQQAVLFDFDLTSRVTWVNDNTIRFNALSNGLHTVRAHLVDPQHNIFANPEASLEFSFYVDVPADDAFPPEAIVFVKEDSVGTDLGRVFDNSPNTVGDLFKLEPPTANGTLTQLTNVAKDGGGVVSPEISFDGQRLLFSMRKDNNDSWKIYEMNVDGTGLRQVTHNPANQTVHDTDPAYLPNGQIIFASDRLKKRDEYDRSVSTQLYTADLDGNNIVLVEPNPSHMVDPQVLRDGRVVFGRWDHLAHSNHFSLWHMNPDGSSGFVFYGGVSPRGSDRLGNAQGMEPRQLDDGTMVGIFTNRNDTSGKLGIFDNRNGDLEDLPAPILVGPEDGWYRTPHPYTTQRLIYSYSSNTDIEDTQYGLYTASWDAESILVDDTTERTPADGSGENPVFKAYTINLDAPARVYVEVTGSADDNGDADDDDLWVTINGVQYRSKLERRLDGDLIEGGTDTFRVDVDLEAGEHYIFMHTDETPTIQRVRIVRAARPGTPVLLYDDPTTNEISPIPVRSTTPPPIYPSRLNTDLSFGTFLVRDISLRGDFRQPNHNTFYDGDPDFHFHLDLEKLEGLRVFQSVELTSHSKDIYAGASGFDPVRVLGLVKPNEFGTTVFHTPANNVTAWDLVGENGEAVTQERVWSLVQPGEVRACGGCHVPQLPYKQREIGPIPAPTDLRTRGRVYDFVSDGLPPMQVSCSTCHTGETPAGGLEITGTRENYTFLTDTGRTSVDTSIIHKGNARNSFLFQLLIGNARGSNTRQTRIDEINANVDHTTLMSQPELYELATWIDLGAAFAYLPNGEYSGTPTVADLNTGTQTNTGISIEFNAPVDRATLNDSTFTLQKVGGSTVSGSFVWGSHTNVTFVPDVPLTMGDYTVALTDSILDINRNDVGDALQPFTGSFTISDSADLTAPQIIEQPAATISPLGQVLFRFNEMIDAGTLSELNLWVTKENGEWVDGGIGVSADSTEIAFAPRNAFEPGETYICNIGDGITDLAGNELTTARESFSFTVAAQSTEQQVSLIADRQVGNWPEDIAVSRDGTQILVANEGSDSISLFDAATNDLISTMSGVGDDPSEVEFSTDNKFAYTLNQRSDDLSIVRLSDGQVLVDLDLVNPARMVLNNAGERLYITERGDADRIAEVDVVSDSPTFGQVLRTLSTSMEPVFLAIAPDDSVLYYARDSRVVEIPLDMWAERRVIQTPYNSSGDIAISPDGRQLAQPSRNNDRVMFVDLVAGQATGVAMVGDYPDAVTWSPDGNFLFIALRHDRTVQMFDMGSFQVEQTLDLIRPYSPERLAMSPDGSRLYVTQDRNPGRLLTFALPDGSDTTAPTVTAFAPTNDTRNVPTSSPLVVDFSEQMDRLSLNPETILLEQNGTPLGVDVEISDDNQRIIIQPTITLLPETDYTLRVTTGAQDVSGNGVAVDVQTTFRTAVRQAEQPFTLVDSTSGVYSPRGVAVTPDGQRVIVSNYYSNDVKVFATDTLEELAHIELEHRVRNIFITPGGTKAYVSRPEVDDVVLVDLNTYEPIDLDLANEGLQGITVGNQPDSFTAHPSQPLLYVTSLHTSDVTVIDMLTDTVVNTWPAFNGSDRDAHQAAITPDGSKLIVTGHHRLAVLDATTGEQLAEYSGMPSWAQFGIVATPDGKQVWFTSADTDELIGFDLTSEQIVARVQVGDYPTWLRMSPDGETIYVNVYNEGSIAVVDWRTATLLNTLKQNGRTFRIDVSADGQTIYQTTESATGLLKWELGTLNDDVAPTVETIAPAGDSAEASALSAIDITFSEPIDRSTVNQWTFALLQGSSRSVQAMSEDAVRAAALAGDYVFSQGNRRVTFVPDAPLLPTSAYTIRLFGISDSAGNWLDVVTSQFTTAAPITPPTLTRTNDSFDSDEPWDVVLSPDKRTLAVTSNYWHRVHLVNPDTLEQFGDSINVGNWPRSLVFSTDGSTLFVGLEKDAQVVAMDVASGLVTRVFEGVTDPRNMILNADGNKLFVAGYYSEGVYTIDLLTGAVEMSQEMSRPAIPTYGPDGKLYVGADNELWRYDEMAGTWEGLAMNGGQNFDVAFSADGRFAFTSQRGYDRLRVIDLDLWRVVRDVAVGDDPRDMVQSADYRLIVLLNANAGNIQVIDTETLATLQSYTLTGGWLSSIMWDEPTGKLLIGENWENIIHEFSLSYANSPLPTPTPDVPPTATPIPQQTPLEVDAIMPEQGVNNLPNEMYVYGDGFTPDAAVFLGNTPLVTTYINEGYLLAIVPTGAQEGVHDVRVSADGQNDILNSAYTVVEGTAHDDLTALDTELWLMPAVPVEGQETQMGLKVHRQGGSAELTNIVVRFYEGQTVLSEQFIDIGADSTVDTSILWTPELNGQRNIWVEIDPLNEHDESVETNNIVRRNIVVMSPPAELEPPVVTSFSINNGAEFTSNANVTLRSAATDSGSGVDALLFIEFEFNQNSDAWIPVRNSGWIGYGSASTMNWLLSPKPGAKYMQVWATDEAGNVSENPMEAYTNLTVGTDSLAAGQARMYRKAYDAGQTVSVCVTSITGDGDLYVWPPDWPTNPVQFSITEETDDCVAFEAPVTGVYQIEAYGYTNAEVSVDFDAAPSRAAQAQAMNGTRTVLNKTALTEPVVGSDDTPTDQQAIPAPPVTQAVPTAIAATSAATVLRQAPLFVAFAVLFVAMGGMLFWRRRAS